MADITADRLRRLFIYDSETGLFVRRVKRGKWQAGSPAGFVMSGGYIGLRIDGTYYKAHRLAWLYVHGAHPTSEIDHINGVTNDNRLCNLRDASRSANEINKHDAQSNNLSSGLRGVSWERQRSLWRARLSLNGKVHHSSFHATADEAHAAYRAAKAALA
jgi:hypothetical protein